MDDLGDEDDAAIIVATATQVTARSAIADIAVERALGIAGLRTLERDRAPAIVITVPSNQWVSAIKMAVFRRRHHVHFALGAAKASARESEAEKAATAISSGHPVVAIAVSPESELAASILASATHRFEVKAIDAALVGRAMKLCMTGRLPRGLKDLDFGKIDFDTLSGCMPRGLTCKEGFRRLVRATAASLPAPKPGALPLPHLRDAVEYGPEVQQWGLDLAADIRDARAGKISWREVDRGAVIAGETGTGKSTLAQILADACEVPLVSASVSELFASSPGYLDSVVKAQRAVFAQARTAAPCILYWDELDQLPNVDKLSPRGRDWWMPVVMDFYLQLDSALADRDGIIVLGATNRPQDISPVLLRNGRMERQLTIGPLSSAGVARVLRTQLGSDLADADLAVVAEARQGVTPAVVMDWVRTARRLARRESRGLKVADLVRSAASPDLRTTVEKHRCAIHEAGHGVLAVSVGAPLELLSIAKDAVSGGRAVFGGETRSLHDSDHLERTIQVLLGGAAAEMEIFGNLSNGSGGAQSSDLSRATELAAMMRASFGMAGDLVWRCPPDRVMHIMTTDAAFRADVERDLHRLFSKSRAILRDCLADVEQIAERLMDGQQLTGREVVSLVSCVQRQAAEGPSRRASNLIQFDVERV